jgi:hypothetical protein
VVSDARRVTEVNVVTRSAVPTIARLGLWRLAAGLLGLALVFATCPDTHAGLISPDDFHELEIQTAHHHHPVCAAPTGHDQAAPVLTQGWDLSAMPAARSTVDDPSPSGLVQHLSCACPLPADRRNIQPSRAPPSC